jgi:hypothetical protein
MAHFHRKEEGEEGKQKSQPALLFGPSMNGPRLRPSLPVPNAFR